VVNYCCGRRRRRVGGEKEGRCRQESLPGGNRQTRDETVSTLTYKSEVEWH
jgi:hypothetical protein